MSQRDPSQEFACRSPYSQTPLLLRRVAWGLGMLLSIHHLTGSCFFCRDGWVRTRLEGSVANHASLSRQVTGEATGHPERGRRVGGKCACLCVCDICVTGTDGSEQCETFNFSTYFLSSEPPARRGRFWLD